MAILILHKVNFQTKTVCWIKSKDPFVKVKLPMKKKAEGKLDSVASWATVKTQEAAVDTTRVSAQEELGNSKGVSQTRSVKGFTAVTKLSVLWS